MPTRADLLHALEESGAELPADLDDDTPLITSGLLDSTALFQLALWVDEQTAPDIDLTTFDLSAEWDSIAKLLAFVERYRYRA